MVVPSSGVLSPGGTVIVSVTGATKETVGGDLVSRFAVSSVGSDSSGSTDIQQLEVHSIINLCQAGFYAKPTYGNNDDVWCEQCGTMEGEEGVDCQSPGATIAFLPIRQGYWRSNNASMVVHECLYSEACLGNTKVSSADDYCADGYRGPCESTNHSIVKEYCRLSVRTVLTEVFIRMFCQNLQICCKYSGLNGQKACVVRMLFNRHAVVRNGK